MTPDKQIQAIRDALVSQRCDYHMRLACNPTAITELLARLDAPRGTNAQILKERELTALAIEGALAYGYQNGEYPPDDAAWLRPFWEIGRRDAKQKSELGAAEADAARYRYAVAIGGNQSINFLDVYEDWDGDGNFTDALDAARAQEGKT